jgi:type VI protein secretion system component VasF
MRGSTFTYDIDTIDVVRNEREPSRITNATTARDATRPRAMRRGVWGIFSAMLCCAVLCYMLHTCSILYISLLYSRHPSN